jgi:hypothetical protein
VETFNKKKENKKIRNKGNHEKGSTGGIQEHMSTGMLEIELRSEGVKI